MRIYKDFSKDDLILAKEFCEEYNFSKTKEEHFIFKNEDGEERINLPYVLEEYVTWLKTK